ncbi:hypothetical protein DM860_008820 [Cuscuta australis]|uniref:Uncharacterized protein n=1 Tax=Cuscuta australis TaxID=267555 RepID=A0A328DB12_9ASTE|nr:hypothetical protein DM860_008820 [Cuscuta australis]
MEEPAEAPGRRRQGFNGWDGGAHGGGKAMTIGIEMQVAADLGRCVMQSGGRGCLWRRRGIRLQQAWPGTPGGN